MRIHIANKSIGIVVATMIDPFALVETLFSINVKLT
jgi:hypothetical protein